MQSSESSSLQINNYGTNSASGNGKADCASLRLWQSAGLWILRITVGAVFAVSGLSKMLDLWGFLFKIEEYLAIWGIVQPRTIILMAAMLLSGYEFVLGVLLMMGCYKRVAPWGLLLSMCVMLPLTAWIWVADPVSDCGCFGEFLKLSNAATFVKNLLLTVALVALVMWNRRLRQALFNPEIQWIVGAWITLYAIIVGLYGYNAQPMVDFREYPVGTNLVAESDADDADYLFIYEKDGNRREYGIDSLPDSTWTFVDRVSAGTADHGDADAIAVYDGDEEVTQDVIEGDGKELILVIPEPRRADVTFTFAINEIYEYADSIGVPFVALLGGDSRSVEMWRDMSMAEYPIYTADDTQLKELARGTASLVMLDDGVVESKTTVASVDPAAVESPESTEAFFAELRGYGARWFVYLNLFFGGALLLLYLFQGLILAIRAKIKRAYRGKAINNS